MTQDVVKDALTEILTKIDPNIKTPITIKTTVEESNTNSYLEFIKDLMFRYILLGLKDPVYSQVFNIVDD